MRINGSFPQIPQININQGPVSDPWDLDLEVKEQQEPTGGWKAGHTDNCPSGAWTCAGASCANCSGFSCGNCGTQRGCGTSNGC